MTLATCIKCGAEKFGAWVPCTCGFTPETPEDRIRSVLLSSPNMSAQELQSVGDQIRSGRSVTFDEETVEREARLLRENPRLTEMPLGCRIAVWIPVVVMIILAVIVALQLWNK